MTTRQSIRWAFVVAGSFAVLQSSASQMSARPMRAWAEFSYGLGSIPGGDYDQDPGQEITRSMAFRGSFAYGPFMISVLRNPSKVPGFFPAYGHRNYESATETSVLLGLLASTGRSQFSIAVGVGNFERSGWDYSDTFPFERVTREDKITITPIEADMCWTPTDLYGIGARVRLGYTDDGRQFGAVLFVRIGILN